jgi:hypothetical protein
LPPPSLFVFVTHIMVASRRCSMTWRKLLTVCLITGVTILGSAWLISSLFIRIRQEKQISVKGYATQYIQSDIGKLWCTVNVTASGMQSGHTALQKDVGKVVALVEKQGFGKDSFDAGKPKKRKVYKKDASGNSTNEIEYYELYQTISLSTRDVDKVKQTASALSGLIADGMDVEVSDPEFLVSNLPSVKLELIAAATRNGLERARMIAGNSGGNVGKLVAARQGVFQITRPDSTEVSSYGRYDTSTIRKTIKAVVNLEYTTE